MQTKFDKLYYINLNEAPNIEVSSMNDFLFCGTNWGYYFTKKVHKDCEKIDDIELVEWNFKKSNPKWIDYDEELELNLVYTD